MTRRARSALFCIVLLATHVFQGSLAASVPCPDDVPGVLVVVALDGTHDAMKSAGCDGDLAHIDHCPFCSSGGCQQTHIPALAVAIVPLAATIEHAADAPAPAADSFRVHFDLILRPPK